MAGKADSIEYEKRIRIVQDWILQDWPSCDIITQIIEKWGVVDRQAKRYIATARARWVEEDTVLLDHKRKMKILSLKKQKKSLKAEFIGTPKGLNALTQIDKLIIMLEGLNPATKIEINGNANLNHVVELGYGKEED